MAGFIDRPGCFLGSVLESTLGQTKENSYPQSIMRLQADKYYASTSEELKHYGITEPGFVDWDPQTTLAYLCLFNDKGPLKNYDQLMSAFNWSGTDFQDLTDFVGKRCLFRVEENTYKDRTSLQVSWIDAEDAPPERTLKAVDAKTVADLNSRFLAGMKKPTTPAKPAAAKASVPASKSSTPTVSPSVPFVPATSVVAPLSGGTPKMPPADAFDPPREKKGKKTGPPVPAPIATAPALPAETTMMEAWEYLNDPAIRGAVDEAKIADAWTAACSAIGEEIPQEDFTSAMWARVRDQVYAASGMGIR